MMIRLCAVMSAFLLSACASSGSPTAASEASTTCSRETPIGSNIAVTRCRTQAEIDQARRDAEQTGQSVRSGTGGPSKKGGV